MTPLLLLAGVGVMVMLAGLVGVIAMLAGVGARPVGTRRRADRLSLSRRGLAHGGVGRGGAGWSAAGWGTLPHPTWWIAGIVALLTVLITGLIPAAAGAAGLVLIAPGLLGGSPGRRQTERLAALAAWIRRVADLLRSGAAGSLSAALRRTADTCPALIKPDVTRLASRLAQPGLDSVEDALRGFADDLADPAADELTMALIRTVQRGGTGLAQVLTALATDLDEQVRVRRQIEAERAKPRTTVRILVGMIVAVTAAMILFARGFLAAYHSPTGQGALLIVVAVIGASLLWLQRLIRIPPGPRLLTPRAVSTPRAARSVPLLGAIASTEGSS